VKRGLGKSGNDLGDMSKIGLYFLVAKTLSNSYQFFESKLDE